MKRLLNLDHVIERARLHGIPYERLQCRQPTVALMPCPNCTRKYWALAEYDGFGVLLFCNGCDDPRMIAARLLAERGEHPLMVETLEAEIEQLEQHVDLLAELVLRLTVELGRSKQVAA